jgi:hypothetical protein
MQSENPFSTSHLWDSNQNKGPKHYSEFLESKQGLDDQRLAFSANTMQQQLINSPVLQGKFTDVRPQSPAMAQARALQERQPPVPYSATTGASMGGAELDSFYQEDALLYDQAGGASPNTVAQNPYLNEKNYNRRPVSNTNYRLKNLGYNI